MQLIYLDQKWELGAKKRVTAHRRETSATGGGQTTTELSPLDNPIASIIGDTALSGIIEDGDTDAQAGPSNIQIEGTRNKLCVCKHFISILTFRRKKTFYTKLGEINVN